MYASSGVTYFAKVSNVVAPSRYSAALRLAASATCLRPRTNGPDNWARLISISETKSGKPRMARFLIPNGPDRSLWSSDVVDEFMKAAVEEARKGLGEGGIPIGSVLVRDGQIIGRGHNKRVQQSDPVMHAEIDCLRNAGRIGKYDKTTLYSTLMPCYLCGGAIVQFGIKKVIVGESETFTGARDFLESYGVEVIDLNLGECKQLMKKFIQTNPELWKEDIGEL